MVRILSPRIIPALAGGKRPTTVAGRPERLRGVVAARPTLLRNALEAPASRNFLAPVERPCAVASELALAPRP